jgi:hypothetical protein
MVKKRNRKLDHLEAPEQDLHDEFCESCDLSEPYSQKLLITALEAHQRARKA